MNNIPSLLILDVDGVLTDGTKAYGPDGQVLWKRFCDHDWTAIKKFQMDGWIVCFLSADRTVNEAVARNRDVDFWYSRDDATGVIDKVKWLGDLSKRYNVLTNRIVYVGDDLLDIPVMKALRTCGGKIYCPASAVPQVQALVDGVLGRRGGDGAIMDLYYSCYSKDDTPPSH